MIRSAIAITVAAGFAASASAALTEYADNFESYDPTAGVAIDNGWLVGATVFESDGTTFAYDYFAFVAPNGTGGFSNIALGQGGAPQGDQVLVHFNDYNNPDHNIGRVIEANFFRDIGIIDQSDVGQTWTFSFDAKAGDLGGASTANAFLKVLDVNNGFNLTASDILDTTALDVNWDRYEVSLTIDQAWVGQLLQAGYSNRAANFDPSGVFYDNINIVPAPASAALLGLGGLAAARRRRA